MNKLRERKQWNVCFFQWKNWNPSWHLCTIVGFKVVLKVPLEQIQELKNMPRVELKNATFMYKHLGYKHLAGNSVEHSLGKENCGSFLFQTGLPFSSSIWVLIFVIQKVAELEKKLKGQALKTGKRSFTSWYPSSWHPWTWQGRGCGLPSQFCCVTEEFWFPLPPQGSCGCWVFSWHVLLWLLSAPVVCLGNTLRSQQWEIKTCLVIWYNKKHLAELLMHAILNEVKAYKSFLNQN